MYLTIKETAEYLSMAETAVENLVKQKKIRAVYDGEPGSFSCSTKPAD